MKSVIGGYGPSWIINDQKEIKVKDKVFTDLKKAGSWPTIWSEFNETLSQENDSKKLYLALSLAVATMTMYPSRRMSQLLMMKIIDKLALQLGWMNESQFKEAEQDVEALEANYRANGKLNTPSAQPTFDINRGDSTF